MSPMPEHHAGQIPGRSRKPIINGEKRNHLGRRLQQPSRAQQQGRAEMLQDVTTFRAGGNPATRRETGNARIRNQ